MQREAVDHLKYSRNLIEGTLDLKVLGGVLDVLAAIIKKNTAHFRCRNGRV